MFNFERFGRKVPKSIGNPETSPPKRTRAEMRQIRRILHAVHDRSDIAVEYLERRFIDEGRDEAQFNIGKAPKGIDPRLFMDMVGKRTEEDIRLLWPGRISVKYEAEISDQRTDEFEAIDPNTHASSTPVREGLRLVFSKQVSSDSPVELTTAA